MLAILLLIAAAEITVTISPEPMAVTRQVYGQVPGVGTWGAITCNDTGDRQTIAAARIYAAAAMRGLRPINKARILILLDRARYERPASRWARAIDVSMMTATAIGATYGLDATALTALAVGTPIARNLADRLRSRVPIFDASEILDGELDLSPGGCVERTIFSGVVKGASTVVLALPGHRRLAVASITSIRMEGE